MACPVTFDNAASTGLISGAASNNGVWELIGFSNVSAGPFGAGGNFPSSNPSWGQSIDTSTIVEGFYQFRYKSSLPSNDPCYGEAYYVLAIVQGTTEIPANVSIDLCSTDPIRNIYDDSGIYDESVINPVSSVLDGGGTSSPGYAAGAGGDITDDTYDPSGEVTFPVVRIFDITYTPQEPAGFSLSGCTNCQPKTMTVTYNVSESFDAGNPSNVATCNDGDVQ